MAYPYVNTRRQQRVLTDTFAGYDHRLKIPDGEWFDTKNLTSKHYPMMSVRGKRGVLETIADTYTQKKYAVGDYCIHDSKLYRCTTAINTAEAWNAEHWTQAAGMFTNLQAIIAKDALYWVDNGTMYANGYATGLTGLQTVKETQLVSMGAYICVFPDKKYINTMNLTEYGSMGANYTYTGNVKYSMCHQDGTIYTSVTESAAAPENPANGDVWVDSNDGSVKEYSTYTAQWVTVETVYTRLDFLNNVGPATAFKEYDGVQVNGSSNDELNGSKIIYAIGTENDVDFIVLIGIQGETETLEETMTIQRMVPDMDFVCEAQNRLWGCFYGNDGTQNINELYCCALGDFKNWEQYLGISTDSWRASRGSDGPWSGCINYRGSPTFFKENIIHPVAVSAVGAHEVGDIPARGVQKGSHNSLAVVNETLYYKARDGIMAYQGGMPVEVGEALGEERYYDAVAGAFGNRYVVSMKDSANAWHLFNFDVLQGIWMREDNLHVAHFTRWDDELYAQVGNSIVALNGTAGTEEGVIEWYAETGIQYYSYPDKKYVSKYDIRLSMALDAQMQIFIEYDSSGLWRYAGTVKLPNTGSVTVPVRPHRCDHMRLRFEGRGDVKIYSIARILEQGSDR